MRMDCDNERMRDALPDLASGAITASEATVVRAHLDGCESCRAELRLVQTIRDRSGVARVVDVAAIVRALPAPPARTVRADDRNESTVVDIASRRRVRAFPAQWRAAAAALIVAAGALGVAVSRPERSPSARPVAVAQQPLAVAPVVVRPESADPRPAVRVAIVPTSVAAMAAESAPTLMMTGAVHDLATSKQRQLLKELEAYDGSVLEDPETARYDLAGEGI